MVKSPRGRLEAFPGRATGGAMIGPLPTTLALAGSAVALDWAWAAPGRGGVAVCASATAQVLTNNAPASFNNRFFIDILVFRFLIGPAILRHQEWLEIAIESQPDLSLVRLGDRAGPAAGTARVGTRIAAHDGVIGEHATRLHHIFIGMRQRVEGQEAPEDVIRLALLAGAVAVEAGLQHIGQAGIGTGAQETQFQLGEEGHAAGAGEILHLAAGFLQKVRGTL